MANETPITVVGRLTQDPELKFTPGGDAVANLNIACNERRYNKQTSDWEDATPVFWRGSAWRELAERISATLHRGDAVVVYGFVQGRSWTDRDTGKERFASEIAIQAIGPDLRWMDVQGTAKAQKQQGGSNGGGSSWGGNQGGGQQAQQPPAGGQQGGQQPDPWSPPGGGSLPAGAGSYDEPPFEA